MEPPAEFLQGAKSIGGGTPEQFEGINDTVRQAQKAG
jgi:hypothetical protein